MKRFLSDQLSKRAGKKVRIKGWVNTRRDHGEIIFLDIRDRKGIVQAVCSPKTAGEIKEEYAVEIEGEAKKRPSKMVNPKLESGEIEIKVEKLKIISPSEVLPFEINKDLNLKLPTLLDFQPLALRNEKIKSIFEIEEEVISVFRESLKKMDFKEFQAPTIVPTATEGGAEVFQIDYYEKKAFLAQSPQFYKQIMLSPFERVFAVTRAYRAEPSITTRHLSEYSSLDAEMAFIDSWEELMDVCEKLIKDIFKAVNKNCQKELKKFKTEIPQVKKIPRLKMREAQEIIYQRTKRDNRKEPDLEPEDEKEISKWAQEKHNSDLVFITHYPTSKRPFYTYQDPEDEKFTLSFDLLFRGLEIVTGGQRINNYEKLIKNIEKWGNKKEDFSFYLQAFKFGMPPEGGFCIGGERIVKQMLNLKNIREATLFPRDMNRIDKRLKINEKD